ncbi:hypothetical protein O181_058059 [Austropuccinia psidii MF-1]|uniref:Uncharacterized protein n=1 Tax=Austropuccinia psidii MF-1 TaxID=1389203 RepID=A0A9Q3EBQ0_9BASI|nr:hypothetical protein [Austropuccinia psidii MF-1]
MSTLLTNERNHIATVQTWLIIPSSPDDPSHPIEESPLEVRRPLLQSLCDEMKYLTEEEAKALNKITIAKAQTRVQTTEISDLTEAIKAKDSILAQLKQHYLKELEAIEQVLQDWSVFLIYQHLTEEIVKDFLAFGQTFVFARN